jgi:hypothetical protein
MGYSLEVLSEFILSIDSEIKVFLSGLVADCPPSSPSIELIEGSSIQSSSGYHAAITYKGKGYISGAPHRFTANISPHPVGNPTLVIEGSWIGQSRFVKTEHKTYTVNSLFADASGSNEDDATSKKGIQVLPIEEQGEMESRRVWKDVADGIRKGDFETAGIAKSKLENEQRSKRKVEKEGGNAHQLHKFQPVQSDEACKFAFLFSPLSPPVADLRVLPLFSL